MSQLMLHEFHHTLGARFVERNGEEQVNDYGDCLAEHRILCETAGVMDLGFRSRLCLVGNDRARFLHGQVTNDVKKLRAGDGCYAAITTAKGKMESDLNIFCFADELLLDFEPGLAAKVSQRLEKFIVADDVQIVDVAPHYGLLSVQGPKAETVIRALGLFPEVPAKPLASVKISDAMLGEIYLVHNARLNRWDGTPSNRDQIFGFDLFIPNNSLGAVADKLIAAAKATGGGAVGWQAFETARIEAGVPRFSQDMDEANIPLECGIESRAVSYNKGCYIGQEIINRVHSFGRVTKELRSLRLADDLKQLPQKGEMLFHGDKEAGYITSAVHSPLLKANIAMGYIRREAVGATLTLKMEAGESAVSSSELVVHPVTR